MKLRLSPAVGALLAQAAFMAAICPALQAAATLLPPQGAGWGYAAAMWIAIPLLGALSAGWAVRRGAEPFFVWIAPPVAMTCAHWLLIGYPPQSVGMPILAALTAMFGGNWAREKARRGRRRETGRRG